MIKFIIERIDDTIEVLLLPHKDGTGFSYVNITKGHICPCKFSSISDAINSMKSDERIINIIRIDKEV